MKIELTLEQVDYIVGLLFLEDSPRALEIMEILGVYTGDLP